jgi:hypothetical protein
VTRATESEIFLSRGVSVTEYRRLEGARDRGAISEFVKERFAERYLKPLDVDPRKRSGFASLAIGCLMIEALESFRQGWPNTDRKGIEAFSLFFGHWSQFKDFEPLSGAFYKHIRCGILHQAETTGGWRIHRKGPLLDGEQRIINATKFLSALSQVLDDHCGQLASEQWESDLWRHFRDKMQNVCQTIKSPPTGILPLSMSR